MSSAHNSSQSTQGRCLVTNWNVSNTNDQPNASHWFSLIFSIIGLGSNLIALCVLVSSYKKTQSRSRSSFLIFLCGLVVTDFMGLLLTGAVVISYHSIKFDWDSDCHLCNFMGLSMVFYGLCPLLLGAAMAVERFIGINRPFTRSTTMSKQRAWSTVMIVWIFAFCLGLMPILGVGSYTIQYPKSWCFISLTYTVENIVFGMLFSLVGLLSLSLSFVLNTISVVTLIKICRDQESIKRRRDCEVEMMVQLIGIMIVASDCTFSVQTFIAQTVLTELEDPVKRPALLLTYIRIATWNQILDPWAYILFRRAVLRKIYPSITPRPSIVSLYPMLATSLRRKFTS
uniref:Thromboxane A2 receptor n=1 Tax=Latimeria chalumnae TaxID=7897 RepID=H3B5A7_LATCH